MANERARGLGYKFVTDDKYLVDPFSPTDGISYEGDGSPVSYANSGIMTQAPIPAPLKYIPQGGNDNNNNNNDNDDDINPYTGPSVSPWEAAKQSGLFFLNPLGFLASKAFKAYQNRNVNKKSFSEGLNKQEKNYNESGDLDDLSNTPSYSIPDTNDPGGNPGGGYSQDRNDAGIQSAEDDMKDGGRAGYFFGGRVNYKAGGRTDAGPNRTTASKAGVGQINESGQKVSGGNFNNNNNDGGNNPPPTFYDNGVQVITDQSKFGFNYPTGLTKNLGVGQLTAILDARKSLEEEEPEGMIQYDSSVGPFDTRTTYDTTTGPEFNATYSNNNLNANYNTKTGLGVNYSKDIGPGTFTAGGTYNPDGTYNAEAKYGISFANGGLASIL